MTTARGKQVLFITSLRTVIRIMQAAAVKFARVGNRYLPLPGSSLEDTKCADNPHKLDHSNCGRLLLLLVSRHHHPNCMQGVWLSVTENKGVELIA